VSADFTYTARLGCQRDTLTISHNGANNVNFWSWTFNNGTPQSGQIQTLIVPATSTNNISLLVSNGTCTDTTSSVLIFNNEVKADFTMVPFICPEDKLSVVNTTNGQVDSWKWNFDVIASSILKDPAPVQFPTLNREAYYTVKLVAYNNALGCADSIRKTLTVLDHCRIAVPTAFTPNNDGRNDLFWPHNALKADNLEFSVYNRWGQLVFQSRNWRDKWDGNLKGQPQQAGVYVWMLRYVHRETKKEVFNKGTVMLIR
jgi:gliding motility-associated-like protein